MTLHDLKKRVDEATGPDRELDFAIALASGIYRLHEPDGGRQDDDTTRYVRYMHPVHKTFWSGSIGNCVPELTASLDAALALVERVLPGCIKSVHQEPAFGLWGAVLVDIGENTAAESEELNTPALAVLSALLAALIAKE